MSSLENKTLAELKVIAKENNLKNVSTMKKEEILEVLNTILKDTKKNIEAKNLGENTSEKSDNATNSIIPKKTENIRNYDEFGNPIAEYKLTSKDDNIVQGILEILPDGYGFLRGYNFLSSDKDIYLSGIQIRRFKLDTGDIVKGISRLREGEKFASLIFVGEVNGEHPEKAMKRKRFDELTPIYPNERLRLETTSNDYAMRIIDLMSPIGKGQRRNDCCTT